MLRVYFTRSKGGFVMHHGCMFFKFGFHANTQQPYISARPNVRELLDSLCFNSILHYATIK